MGAPLGHRFETLKSRSFFQNPPLPLIHGRLRRLRQDGQPGRRVSLAAQPVCERVCEIDRAALAGHAEQTTDHIVVGRARDHPDAALHQERQAVGLGEIVHAPDHVGMRTGKIVTAANASGLSFQNQN